MESKGVFCPFCNGADCIKYGTRNGRQRYRCASCGRVFLDATGTIFSSAKLDRETLRRLIILIINDTKLKAVMDALSVSSRTAYMWRMKVYKAAGEIVKGTMLSGKVWIDEKLVRVNRRYLLVRPDGLRYRGQSKNQIVIACAVDADGNKYAEVVGRGHISSKQCIESYGRHIAPGSYIVHDGIFSHDRLLSHLGSSGEIWKSTARESKGYMQPINSFCAEIERNLVIHIGLRDENLQDYLNWVVFRSTINEDNIGLKVAELESKCFQNKVTYRIKDRYRRKK